jgi:hypothetical protein
MTLFSVVPVNSSLMEILRLGPAGGLMRFKPVAAGAGLPVPA